MFEYDFQGKVIIAGDKCVGKTAYSNSLYNRPYNQAYEETKGIQQIIKPLDLYGYYRYRFRLWDMGGSEKNTTMKKIFYQGISGVILAYSITDRNSFQNLQSWIRQIYTYTDLGMIKILIATKSDMEGRQVPKEQGFAQAERYNMKFIQVSSKNNTNIEESFEMFVELKNQINLSKKNQKIMDKTIAKINSEAEQLVKRYEEEKQKNEKLQFLVKHIEEEIYKAKLDKAVELKNKIQTDKLEQFTSILKTKQKDLEKVCQKTNTSSYELSKKLDTIRALRSQRTIVSQLLDKIERQLCNLEHCYKVLVIQRTVGDKLCKQKVQEFNKLQISAKKELEKVIAIAQLSKPQKQSQELKPTGKLNHDSRSSFAQSPNTTGTIQVVNERYTIQSQFGKDKQKFKQKKIKLENDLLKLEREKKVKIVLNDLGLSSAKELPPSVQQLQFQNGTKLDQVCRLNEQIEKVEKCISSLSKKKKVSKQIAPHKQQYLIKMQQMKKTSDQIKSLRLQTRQFKEISKILYQSIQQSANDQVLQRQFFNQEEQIVFYMGFLQNFFEKSYLEVKMDGNTNKKNVSAAKRLTSLLNNHQFERNHYSIYEEKDLLDFAKKNLQKLEKTSSKLEK